MLSRYNCCPQLYLGEYSFRIFNRPLENCIGTSVDGIIYHKDTSFPSPFRRYLLSIESLAGDCLSRYRLCKEKLNHHDATLGLLFLNRLKSVNVRHTYGILYAEVYYEKCIHTQSFSTFLQEANDEQVLSILVQLGNLCVLLEENYEVLGFDAINACTVQILDRDFLLKLTNGRQLTTDVLLKLENFSYLALSDHNAEYYNLRHALPARNSTFRHVLVEIQRWRLTPLHGIDKTKSEDFLDVYSKLLFLPRYLGTPTVRRSSDTSLYQNREIATYLDLVRYREFFRSPAPSRLCQEAIAILLERETENILRRLKQIKRKLKANVVEVSDLDEPDIGVGTGIFEKKIICWIQQRTIYREVRCWFDFARIHPIAEKVGSKIRRVELLFERQLKVVKHHGKQIRTQQGFASYIKAYQLLRG